jgi:hypothetical protein
MDCFVTKDINFIDFDVVFNSCIGDMTTIAFWVLT